MWMHWTILLGAGFISLPLCGDDAAESRCGRGPTFAESRCGRGPLRPHPEAALAWVFQTFLTDKDGVY